VAAIASGGDGRIRLRAGGPGGGETVVDRPAGAAPVQATLDAGACDWVRAELYHENPWWGRDEVRALTSPVYLSAT
jgi:hypothetical protein